MNPFDFEYLRKLLKERSGLALAADKRYLLESRLLPVARRNGIAGLSELTSAMRASGAERLIVEVVEAMTTNESFFFRDKIPFDNFRDFILPALLAARAKERHIRIWCAAGSTGQEPYSLAMILRDMAHQVSGWRIDIVASDLSTEVIDRAREGVYTQFEVQRGLPIGLLVKHFTQNGEKWQIAQSLRTMVDFRQINLLHGFTHLGRFDIVFCRNVLIYFDQETKIDVFERMATVVASDGYLVLGAAETVVGLTDRFRPVADKRGVYCPAAGAAANAASRRPAPVSALTTRTAAAR